MYYNLITKFVNQLFLYLDNEYFNKTIASNTNFKF